MAKNISKRQALLLVAVGLGKKVGYLAVTRDRIASEAGVGMGTVTNHLGTMAQIRRAIVRYAIRNEELPIICQAVCNKHPLALKLDPDLKRRALDSL